MQGWVNLPAVGLELATFRTRVRRATDWTIKLGEVTNGNLDYDGNIC